MRRVLSILIAGCLFLPLQSCSHGGKVDVYYPLSGDTLGVFVMASIYLLPLAAAFFNKKHEQIAISLGMFTCLVGLYFVTYTATLWATHLLVGWYVYTASSLAYIVTSGLELRWLLWANRSFQRTPSAPLN
jgi:hypothetical protein